MNFFRTQSLVLTEYQKNMMLVLLFEKIGPFPSKMFHPSGMNRGTSLVAILAFCLSMIQPITLLAQTLRIERLKGQKALVEITSGQVEIGKTYSLQSSDGKMTEATSNDSHGRRRVLGLEGSILGYTSETSTVNGSSSSRSTFSFQSYFGWNFKKYELGPILSFVTSSGGVQTSSFGIGGFFDYNLAENTSERKFLLGLLGSIQLLNAEAGGSKSSGQTLAVGGFLKWFPGPSWLCLRSNLKYEMTDSKTSLVTTKTTGFSLTSGVAGYF
jgi:hypothetical protein